MATCGWTLSCCVCGPGWYNPPPSNWRSGCRYMASTPSAVPSWRARLWGFWWRRSLTLTSRIPSGFAQPAEDRLFPAGYRIPGALHSSVRNKRVAIVSDVVNAGSAVRGTFAALVACGATPVAVGALVVLGTAASEFASSRNLVLESIAALPNSLWTPSECPLCVSGAMLENVGGFTG